MATDTVTACRTELLDSVVPFWLANSLDREYGGYLHHLDRDGSVYCTDKMMWMEHREVWMFSRLYNRLERRAEWLDAARLGAEFLREHGRDKNGDWYFLLDRQGHPLIAPYNVFSDLFAVLAYLEYATASGEGWPIDLARATFERIEARAGNPKGSFEKRLPAARTMVEHAFPMMNFHVTRELASALGDPIYDVLSRHHLGVILDTLLDPKTGLLYEYAMPDGSRPHGPAGRLVNPGHAIESAWFMLEYARELEDEKLITTAVRILNAAFEIGWDGDHGGLLYFVDVGGFPPLQLEWSMKLWWPHVEALYAFLLGYKLTGEATLLAKHELVFRYCWERFRDPAYGEWYGYLDREGRPTHFLKGGRFKGFYHLPRGLLNCVLL